MLLHVRGLNDQRKMISCVVGFCGNDGEALRKKINEILVIKNIAGCGWIVEIYTDADDVLAELLRCLKKKKTKNNYRGVLIPRDKRGVEEWMSVETSMLSVL